ncbi:MAG: TIGR03016 family PEP-CTERM system-associated outer membrane protein [Gammaproteobacteria bacterium]
MIRIRLIVALPLIYYSANVFAYTLTPALQVGEYYSDNVFLTQPKQSDWITQIIPSIQFEERTGKSEFIFGYQLQVLESSHQSQFDRTFHQGSLRFDTKQDRLGFDLASQYTQDIVNPVTGISPNNLIGPERPDVLTTSAMPSVSLPIGDFGDADLSWRYGQVNYYGVDIAPTHDNRQTANLKSGKMFQDVEWTWFSSNQESRQNDRRVSRLRQSQLTTFIKLTQKIRGVASFGTEDNQGSQLESISGENWSLGLQWFPSRNSQFQAQIGHRPYGKSYVFNAFWQRKRSLFTASYNETVTTDAQSRLESLPQNLLPVSTSRAVQFFPQVTNQLFINRQFNLAWQYQYRKSTFIIDIFRDRREFVRFPLHENGKGYTLSWIYNINSDLQSTLSHGSADQDFFNGFSNPWSRETASLDWLIGPQLSLQFTGQHFSSKPNPLPSVTENSISLNIVYKPNL